jgi:hypothetical protein
MRNDQTFYTDTSQNQLWQKMTDNLDKSPLLKLKSAAWICTIITVLFLPEIALGQSSSVGTAGAQFLKINAGARAEAMKGAYVSVTNNADGVFWNPAGLANIQGTSATFSNIDWWADVNVNQIGFATKIDGFGTLGLSVTGLEMPEQEITTVDEPDGTGRFYDANDLMIGVSFARYLIQDFSFGATAKYVHQRIWNETASALAFDVGTQYHFGFYDLVLGMSARNFGPDMRYDGDDLRTINERNNQDYPSRRPREKLETLDFPLPLNFQVGISGKPVNNEHLYWLLSTDIINPNDNAEQIATGTEFAFKTNVADLFVRGGYLFNNPEETWAAGAGTIIRLSQYHVRVDFSYTEHEYLNGIQRFTFSLNF